MRLLGWALIQYGYRHSHTQMGGRVETRREKHMKMEVWSDVSLSQGTPKMADRSSQARKRQGRISPAGFRGRMALVTP